MFEAKTCGPKCSKTRMIQMFMEGSDIPSDLLLSCEECFREFTALEETAVSVIHKETDGILDSVFASENEIFDLAKAELLLDGKLGHDVPEFLKNYMKMNLSLGEKKDALIVKLSEKGVQLISSLLTTIQGRESYMLLPSLRSSLDTLPEHKSSVIFEETTNEGQTFYYQIVKENANEAYLTVKAETSVSGLFRQVNLRKNGRFILSNKIGVDGVVSFSGLEPGDYVIEFQGENISKSFDLCLLVE